MAKDFWPAPWGSKGCPDYRIIIMQTMTMEGCASAEISEKLERNLKST